MDIINVHSRAHALQDANLLSDLHTAHFLHLFLRHHIKKSYAVCQLKYFLNQERVDEVDQRAVCILKAGDVAVVHIILVIVEKLGQEGLGVDTRMPNDKVLALVYVNVVDYLLLPFLRNHLTLLVRYVDSKSNLFNFEGLRAFQQ